MTIQAIENHPTYKRIMSDSFGGVMYDESKRHAYDDGKDTLLTLWAQLTDSQKDRAGGVMKGAMHFLQETA